MSKAGKRILESLSDIAEMDQGVVAFVVESNRIEGIYRTTQAEIEATEKFLSEKEMSLTVINEVQSVYAPGMRLRDRVGMNVVVGNYVAPRGGRNIEIELMEMAGRLNKSKPGIYDNPWKMHVEFERLHPFMDGNGRTGRVIWAWHMKKLGLDPFALPFLHRFYYQTLENDSARN